MTFRDRMSAMADRMRSFPGRIDERPTSVTIRTKTWSGGRIGDTSGPTSNVDVVLTPRPRVREVNVNEIASSAGRYSVGDYKVGPITPAYAGGGGYTEAQLAPVATDNGVEVFYVLAGNVNGEFARIDLRTDGNHGWILTLRTRRTTP